MGGGATGSDAGRTKMLARGLLAACPACGGRGLFHRPGRRGWLRIRPACPTCGLVFERTHGHWIGAVAVNTVLSAAAILIALVASFTVAWPDPAAVEVLVPTVGTSLVAPLVLAPTSRTLWTAMVVLVLPPEPVPAGAGRPGLEADLASAGHCPPATIERTRDRCPTSNCRSAARSTRIA